MDETSNLSSAFNFSNQSIDPDTAGNCALGWVILASGTDCAKKVVLPFT